MVRLVEMTKFMEADIEYDRSVMGRVVAYCRSYLSGKFTRLAHVMQTIGQKEEEVKILKKEAETLVRENLLSLFEATDAANTRVVETVSFIFTLSKDPAPTESYKNAKILEEFEKHLAPDLLAVLNDIKEQYKTITPKKASLKIEPKESASDDNDVFRPYANKVFNFLDKYDAKLARLKQMAAQV